MLSVRVEKARRSCRVQPRRAEIPLAAVLNDRCALFVVGTRFWGSVRPAKFQLHLWRLAVCLTASWSSVSTSLIS